MIHPPQNVSSRVALFITAAMILANCTAQRSFAAEAGGSLPDESLREIKFDQRLNQQVSLELQFRDEAGATVRLRDYFGKKPVILNLGYYECPMLCTVVLNGMVESFQDLKLDVGKQFEVVNVSVAPDETPELGAAKKRTYLKRYGRPEAARGWHFLTGDEAAIKQLADEAGFRYAFDPVSKQYAHPSGFLVLTPDGKVSRYFFGSAFRPQELDAALKQAGAGRAGSPIEQFVLLCFHYSPLTGKYGPLVLTVVRWSGIATLAGLGCAIVIASRRRRKEVRP